MIVNPFTEVERKEFLRMCEAFYNSNVTKRPFNYESATMTFNRILEKHENLWGFFIKDSQTGRNAGYALITSYWCNEEGGNVIILDELYVDVEFRHRGFASRFIEWLCSEFHGKGVSVTLEVLTTNTVAKELYMKEGLIEDGFVTLEKQI